MSSALSGEITTPALAFSTTAAAWLSRSRRDHDQRSACTQIPKDLGRHRECARIGIKQGNQHIGGAKNFRKSAVGLEWQKYQYVLWSRLRVFSKPVGANTGGIDHKFCVAARFQIVA